jgi:hypothetical protein
MFWTNQILNMSKRCQRPLSPRPFAPRKASRLRIALRSSGLVFSCFLEWAM